MPHVDLGQFRMYYEGAGEGEPLVLLHGFTLDRRQWQPQIEFFRDHYHVLAPDARGHGLSDAPLTGYSRADRVQDLADFVDTLKIEKFHLLGLSMGGATAIGYALKYPERLQSLILASAGAAGAGLNKKMVKLNQIAREDGIKIALDKWRTWSLSWYKKDRQELGKFLDSMMADFSGATWSDPMRGKYPRDQDMAEVYRLKMPTLLLTGEQDSVFSKLGEELTALIEGSRLICYEKTGHMLNLEQPTRFNADIKAFLEGVAPI